jgi:hypothetical protein
MQYYFNLKTDRFGNEEIRYRMNTGVQFLLWYNKHKPSILSTIEGWANMVYRLTMSDFCSLPSYRTEAELYQKQQGSSIADVRRVYPKKFSGFREEYIA